MYAYYAYHEYGRRLNKVKYIIHSHSTRTCTYIFSHETSMQATKLKIVEKDKENLEGPKNEALEYTRQQRKLMVLKSILYQLNKQEASAQVDLCVHMCVCVYVCMYVYRPFWLSCLIEYLLSFHGFCMSCFLLISKTLGMVSFLVAFVLCKLWSSSCMCKCMLQCFAWA